MSGRERGLLLHRIRSGAYYDSVVLMRLQAALAELPGIGDAGVVMATEANLEILEASGLRPAGVEAAPADLLIAVRAESRGAAEDALGEVDSLLARRQTAGGGGADDDYQPRSLRQAFRLLPEARWVLVSVPGRHAGAVAREALEAGRNVLIYSDNVSLEEETALKERAAGQGLLVLGPDCGTAWIGGAGLAFANRVRRGKIGIVAASGTGLQAVASRIHALGAGISQGIGTGGRDLGEEIGGRTALAALGALARDPSTEVVVLLSKPPAPAVAAKLLARARAAGKPVVVQFQGAPPPAAAPAGLHFVGSLEEAARKAVDLLAAPPNETGAPARDSAWPRAGKRRWLRGLFSGGTLAYEALLGLRWFLQPLASNLSLPGVSSFKGAGSTQGRGHVLLDLGEDAFTVGRLHPMMDPDLRLRRLHQETEDPEVACLFLDVVLGDGAHGDPAGAFAPAVAEAVAKGIEVVVLLLGTDEDPQGLDPQKEKLQDAGARVFGDLGAAVEALVTGLASTAGEGGEEAAGPFDPRDLEGPPAVVNVGVEAFHESLLLQGARSVHVRWRPPAGGDERLAEILAKLKGR